MDLIFLCGLSGAGKTTIGKLLAEKLKLKLVDLDGWIEQKFGESISTLFETRGEPWFREQETNELADICNKTGAVVALGGGSLEDSSNVNRVLNSGTLIYLQAPIETLAKRLANQTDRPLLRSESTEARIGTLNDMLHRRESGFLRSNFVVKTESKSIEEIVSELAAELSRA